MRTRGAGWRAAVAAVLAAGVVVAGPAIGSAQAAPVEVASGAEWQAAWTDPAVTAIVLTADVETGCDSFLRPAGSAVTVDGAGHTLTIPCNDGTGTLMSHGTMAFVDIEVLGPTGAFTPTLWGRGIVVERSTITGRNDHDTIMVDTGSVTIVDSTVESGPGGVGLASQGDTVEVRGSTIVGGRFGIYHLGASGRVGIAASTVVAAEVAALVEGTAQVERSRLDGGIASLRLTALGAGASTITDSTLAVGAGHPEEPGGALRVAGTAGVDLVHVTVAPGPTAGDAAVVVLSPGAVTMRATVVAGPAGQPACAGTGAVTSEGDSVASDDSCGLAGPGDRVLVDPGLEPYDPALGYAAPVVDGPLVDAVATCGSDTDQLGTSRPQGPRCDVGAIELDQPDLPPPSSSTTVDGRTPPRTASPATPVRTTARFTG